LAEPGVSNRKKKPRRLEILWRTKFISLPISGSEELSSLFPNINFVHKRQAAKFPTNP